MPSPDLFTSKTITAHLLSWLVVSLGGALAIFFSITNSNGLLWLILFAGYAVFLTGFAAFPVAAVRAYRAIKERKLLLSLQYGAICILSGGTIATMMTLHLIAAGRH